MKPTRAFLNDNYQTLPYPYRWEPAGKASKPGKNVIFKQGWGMGEQDSANDLKHLSSITDMIKQESFTLLFMKIRKSYAW